MSDLAIAAPAVSIVVVTYNHRDFIGSCLDSCLTQLEDGPSLEIVVADDGSTDGTSALVEDYSRRHPGVVRHVRPERNEGIAYNFNRGLAAARGEFVAWLGGDDLMLPGKLARQIAILRDHPRWSGCYHDAEVFAWPSDRVLGTFFELYAGKAAQAAEVGPREMLDPRYQMLPSTLLVRRAAMAKAFDARLRFHNDFLFDLETIIASGPYGRMDGVYARYRKHDRSIGLDPATRASLLEENLVTLAIVEARYPELARAVRRRASYYLTLEIGRQAAAGHRDKASRYARLMAARGAWVRGSLARAGAPILARLLDPRWRSLAIRVRSLLG